MPLFPGGQHVQERVFVGPLGWRGWGKGGFSVRGGGGGVQKRGKRIEREHHVKEQDLVRPF